MSAFNEFVIAHEDKQVNPTQQFVQPLVEYTEREVLSKDEYLSDNGIQDEAVVSIMQEEQITIKPEPDVDNGRNEFDQVDTTQPLLLSNEQLSTNINRANMSMKSKTDVIAEPLLDDRKIRLETTSSGSGTSKDLVDVEFTKIKNIKCEQMWESNENLQRYELHTAIDIKEDFTLTTPLLESTKSNGKEKEKLKKYACQDCNNEHTNLSNLIKHLDENLYASETCGKEFKHSSNLQGNQSEHIVNNKYRCMISDEDFTQSRELEAHIRTHEETPDEAFSSNKELKSHHIVHTDERNECEIYGEDFDQSCELQLHTRSHAGESCYVCSLCDKSFATSTKWKRHQAMHSRRYKCHTCGRRFIKPWNLKKHNCHVEKRYECHCGIGFTEANSFQAHARIHAGLKPYLCEECGEAFDTSIELNTHQIDPKSIRKHAALKPSICDECGEEFASSSELYKHRIDPRTIRKHAALIPYDEAFGTSSTHQHLLKYYKCVLCGRRYKDAKGLHAHIHRHDVITTYKCNTCAEQFSTSSELELHQLMHTADGTLMTQHEALTDQLQIKLESSPSCSVTNEESASRLVDVEFVEVKSIKCEQMWEGHGHEDLQSYQLHSAIDIQEDSTVTSPLLGAIQICGKKRGNRKKRECQQCGKYFTRPWSLTHHMMVHTGERPHACDTCGKKFTQRGHLRRHQAVHTGQPTYKCNTCARAFATAAILKDHQELHTTDKK